MPNNLDKSIRRVSDEQFAQGTTIDGLRIDRAIEDVAERIGALRVGDLKGKFKPVTRVLGMAPAWLNWADKIAAVPPEAPCRYDGASGHPTRRTQLPFLTFDNLHAGVYAAPENRQRAKGMEVSGPLYSSLLVRAFSSSIYVERPLVLDAFDVMLVTDGNEAGYAGATCFSDDFQEVLGGNWYKWIHLQISVDSPFNPNDRQYNQVLAHRWDWTADGGKWTHLGGPAAYANVSAYCGGMPGGLAMALEGLAIPVPRKSRVRFVVGLQEVNTDETAPGDAPQPVIASVVSATISTLELVSP